MTQSEISAAVAKAAQLAKESNPLTPSITNTVTINFVANAQLAVGGSAAWSTYRTKRCHGEDWGGDVHQCRHLIPHI